MKRSCSGKEGVRVGEKGYSVDKAVCPLCVCTLLREGGLCVHWLEECGFGYRNGRD
jgi:hypothetical protein